MTTVRFDPLTPALARSLAPQVVEEDALEVKRTHGHTTTEALEYSLSASGGRASVLLLDDEPAAMFGLAVFAPDKASPWMLTLPPARRHRRLFWRLARAQVDEWARDYELFQCADPQHPTSERFLRSVGFEFFPSYVSGPAGDPLLPARRRRSV